MMGITFEDRLRECQSALSHEARFLQNQGGARHRISEGRFLQRADKRFIYLFLLGSEITLPDGSPVRVHMDDKRVKGEVISVEGFDLTIELDDYLGEEVDQADLYSEPWFLLDELSKRLGTISENGATRLVRHTLSGHALNKVKPSAKRTAAEEMAVRAELNPATYIWGPPGTGKTHTLAEVTIDRLATGWSVLLLAHSNAAVDALLHRICELMTKADAWQPGRVVRYGVSKMPEVAEHDSLLASRLVEYHDPDLRDNLHHLTNEKRELRNRVKNGLASEREKTRLAKVETDLRELRELIKQMEETYVQRASVVGVTLSKAVMSPLVHDRRFDLVIVDEASMAYIPQVIFAASLASRSVVVCGDFKQLPPIALSEGEMVEKWLKRDIFEVTHIAADVEAGQTPENLVILDVQRRMHRDIAAFSNHKFYGGRLKDHDTVKERDSISRLDPFEREPVTLVDLSRAGAYALLEYNGTSRFNVASAMVSVHLMMQATKNGAASIGFISPYNAQARLVTACLSDIMPSHVRDRHKVMAATVHRFQGSEKDIIIYDMVDSYPQRYPSVLLTKPETGRLVNVAVTRARGKLVQVADTDYLHGRLATHNPTLGLLDYAVRKGGRYGRDYVTELLTGNPHERLAWYDPKQEAAWLEDIMNATEEILISIPTFRGVSETLVRTLATVGRRAQLIVISPEACPSTLAGTTNRDFNMVTPMMIIDRRIVWYGVPIHQQRDDTGALPPLLIGRMIAPRAAKLLINLLGIRVSRDTRREIAAGSGATVTSSSGLQAFLTAWGLCPKCNGHTQPQLDSAGRIHLYCTDCGRRSTLTTEQLEQFIAFTGTKCPRCGRELRVTTSERGPLAQCSRCGALQDGRSMW